MTTQEAFVDSVDEDQTAQNVGFVNCMSEVEASIEALCI